MEPWPDRLSLVLSKGSTVLLECRGRVLPRLVVEIDNYWERDTNQNQAKVRTTSHKARTRCGSAICNLFVAPSAGRGQTRCRITATAVLKETLTYVQAPLVLGSPAMMRVIYSWTSLKAGFFLIRRRGSIRGLDENSTIPIRTR
jgi:hypothetical protein